MKGIIKAYTQKKQWGFIKDSDGGEWFFHLTNSPNFVPSLGMAVEFDLAPPFRLGQPEQAVNLRRVEESTGGGGQ